MTTTRHRGDTPSSVTKDFVSDTKDFLWDLESTCPCSINTKPPCSKAMLRPLGYHSVRHLPRRAFGDGLILPEVSPRNYSWLEGFEGRVTSRETQEERWCDSRINQAPQDATSATRRQGLWWEGLWHLKHEQMFKARDGPRWQRSDKTGIKGDVDQIGGKGCHMNGQVV